MRFWKFIKYGLKGIQEEEKTELPQEEQEQFQENEQQTSNSQNDNLEQQSEEESQESGQSSSDSESNSSDEQGEEQSKESGQSSSDSESNSSGEQNEEQSQESGQSSGDSESDSSDGQGEEQEQTKENGESSSDSENNSSGQQSEEESQESKQQSSDSQSNSSEHHDEEQSQESGQSSSDSESNSSGQQSEEESQESKQQSSDSQSNSSEQQGEEQSENSKQLSGTSQSNILGQLSQELSDSSQSNSSEHHDEEKLQESEELLDDFQDDNSEQQIEELAEEIENDSKLTNEQKKQLLEKLKKSIEEIRNRKALKLKKENLHSEKQEVTESKEENYELSEQTSNFLNQLRELPSFEDRERGPGYSIDTESSTEVPDSLIRTLITKFLNQRFCIRATDLNVRSNSLEKSYGFYKWNVKDVIVDSKTHQLNKVLHDKYGYDYSDGRNQSVPLSFYFDMSGSMSNYTNMLAVIAIELLKKNVKVLIGFNEKVNVQIESIEKNITVQELAEILESAGYWNNSKKDPRVKFKYIARNLDNYLINSKAEKCVVFADFDPISEVINLSQAADVYWFCFESDCDVDSIKSFQGFVYKVQSLEDLVLGLGKVNEKRFEALCYVDNPKILQKEHTK